jgi:hypothetical protein
LTARPTAAWLSFKACSIVGTFAFYDPYAPDNGETPHYPVPWAETQATSTLLTKRFERDTLLLEWSIGTIRIRGPKAEIFFDKFANHQATSIGADGRDIESVTMRLKTDEAVEEAFAAIQKLTDADLNIDDEPDEQV